MNPFNVIGRTRSARGGRYVLNNDAVFLIIGNLSRQMDFNKVFPWTQISLGMIDWYSIKSHLSKSNKMSKIGLGLLTVLVLAVIGCENKEIIMDNGLIIEDIIVGVGTLAEKYSIATVHYTGKLQDGTVFDSSQKIGQEPLRFTLGVGQVIDGWDQGVIGMKVGGQRKWKIPPELGYGSQDKGVIPPNSTLIFKVELLEVE